MRLAGLLLAWGGGLALQLQQAEAWPFGVCVALLIAGLAGVAIGLRWRRVFVLTLAGAMACGAGWAGARALWRLGDALPPVLEGRDLQVTGVVASLPKADPSGTRFLFEVEAAQLDGSPVHIPGLLALGWYRQWHDEATLAGPRDELRAGQRWQLRVRLKRPHGSLNPGGFDYELWLFEQGVRATGYVRDADVRSVRRLHDAAGYPVERLRQRVHDAIFAAVSDPRAAGVLAALAVGDQAAIEREDWDLFRAAGIAHLVSISGLHITMFALLAGGLAGRAWRRSAWLMQRCPAPWAARWGGVLAAAGYSLLAGWGVPAQRTVWMLATAAALSTLGLRWPWPLLLLAAGAVVGLLDPWALLQPGFWLSFTAVGLLMASSPVRERAVDVPADAGWQRWLRQGRGVLRDTLRSQLVATIGLAPLTLVFFQQLSLVSFAANLLAIPLITLVITPLALLGVLLTPLWWLGAVVVQWLVKALAGLTAWPGAVWMLPLSPGWAQAAALLAAALAVMPLPWRLRLLAVPLALPLLWPALPRPTEGHFELVAADIGITC
jgi:competence protein ComEC